MTNIIIEEVAISDIDEILRLQIELLLNKQNLPSDGFLVSAFTAEDYQDFFDKGNLFYKATHEGAIVGILMAFPSYLISENDVNNNIIKNCIIPEFILIKQIFVAKGFQKRGIAAQLYEHLKLQYSNTVLAAVTVLEPLNLASSKFHKKQSFYEFLHFIPDADKDGKIRKRAGWLYLPADAVLSDVIRFTNTNPDDNAEVLLSRSSDLVNLYMHEDNLNWTKFERQLVILFALMAVLGYVFNKQISLKAMPLIGLVILWGLIINLFFILKIKSGLLYMLTYKTKIKENDKILSFYYPQIERLFTTEKIAKKSITSKLLLIVSVLGLITWILASILLICNLLKIVEL